MMNMIRADVYRIVRGKALYITFGALFLIMMLLVFGSVAITMGIQTTEISEYESQLSALTPNGATVLQVMFANVNIVMYFILPLIIAVANAMFSSGAAKNAISRGMSRVKIYLAKWVLSTVLCLLMLFFFIAAGVLTAIIFNGAGVWSTELVYYGLRAFYLCGMVLTAANSLGIFLTFAFKNSGAVTGAYCVITVVPGFVMMLLAARFPFLEKIYAYDLTVMLNTLNTFSQPEGLTSRIVSNVLACMGYIIVTTIAGIALFKRAEIK